MQIHQKEERITLQETLLITRSTSKDSTGELFELMKMEQ